MHQELERSAERYNRRYKRKRRWLSLMRVLGCMVVFCTTYALILPAITLDKGPNCGLVEHQHDASCYLLGEGKRELICELDEILEHEHDDGCYEDGEPKTVLICDRTEHVHSDVCLELEEDDDEGVLDKIGSFFDKILDSNGKSRVGTASDAVKMTTEAESASAEAESTVESSEAEIESAEAESTVESSEAEIESASAEAESAIESSEAEIESAEAESTVEHSKVESEEDWSQTFADVKLTKNWAKNVLAIAKSQLGYKESTTDMLEDDEGNMRGYTRYGDWYGDPYGEWNMAFLAFCLNYAEVPVDEFPFDEDCELWIGLLEEIDLYHTEHAYVNPGDIVFFDMDIDGSADHAGIVRKRRDKGGITAIEGDVKGAVKAVIYAPGEERIVGFGSVSSIGEVPPWSGLVKTDLEAELYVDDTYEERLNGDIAVRIQGMLPEGVYARAYPVQAEVEGQLVLCAYDITLFDAEDNIYEPDEKNAITVSFPIVTLIDDAEMDYNIYYIPDSGEPEKMEDASVSDMEVSFTAPHFSVYALTADLVFTHNVHVFSNTQIDAFIKDPNYAIYYNENSPIGTAGSFHIVAFEEAHLQAHTNGNLLAKKVYANSNFGTNGLERELSYIQEYVQVNGNSASGNNHILAIGSNNRITSEDNGNAFGINGRKIDKPKHLVVDADTSVAPFIDLDRVKEEIEQISLNLDEFTDGGTNYVKDPHGQYGELTLKDPSGVGVVTYQSSKLAEIAPQSNLRIGGFESDKNGTVIINVDCSDVKNGIVYMPNALMYIDGVQQGTDEVTEFSNGKVVWNFINAEGITIEAKRMTGMIVAPGATVVATQNLNGTIVADHVYIKAESHRTDFTGKITEPDFEPEWNEYYVSIRKIETGYAGHTLAGAEFKLEAYIDGEWVQQHEEPLITGEDGMLALRMLYPDTAYRLTETAAPKGYVLKDEAFLFWVRSNLNMTAPVSAPSGFNGTALSVDDTVQVNNDPIDLSTTTSVRLRKEWYTIDGSVYHDIPIESITVNLYQSTDLEPEVKVLYQTVEVTAADGWRQTIENLPLYGMTEDGEYITYHYTIEEVMVEEFVTDYVEQDGVHVIQNTQIPYSVELPETGGFGELWYILCGICVMAAALMYGYWQRCRKERRYR